MEEVTGFFKYFMGAVLFCILLILSDLLFPLTWIKEAGQSLLHPVIYYTRSGSLTINDLFQKYRSVDVIFQENTKLKEVNSQLKGIDLERQELEAENALLRETLKVDQHPEISKILAEVLLVQNDALSGKIVLDKGKNEGVEVNMPVLIDRRLVGLVVEVLNHRSYVRLITSSESNLPVKVIGQDDKALGFLSGGFGLQMKLMRVDQDAVINVGDLLVTTGQNSNFPADLVVGEISEVLPHDDASLYREAKVTPMVDFDHLRQVLIIKQTNF